MHEFVATLKAEECLYETCQWITEHMGVLVKTGSEKPKVCVPAEVVGQKLQRSYMWSHHIWGGNKKRTIKDYSNRHGFTGFCMCGKPGVLVWEGDADAVKRSVSYLKSLPWKMFKVRHEEEEKVDDVDAARRFGRFEFFDKAKGDKSDLGTVMRRMEEAGLAEHYNTILGVEHLTGSPKPKGKPEKRDSKESYSKYKKKKGKYGKRDFSTSPEPEDVHPCSFIKETKQGVVISCHVKPNAKRTEIASLDGDELEVRLAAQPRDGAANKELCAFLAQVLRVPKKATQLQGGGKSRTKVVSVAGITIDEAKRKILMN